jgi:hypothetical protein
MICIVQGLLITELVLVVAEVMKNVYKNKDIFKAGLYALEVAKKRLEQEELNHYQVL